MLHLLSDDVRALVLSQVTAELKSKYDRNAALFAISLVDDTPASADVVNTLVDHARQNDEYDIIDLVKHEDNAARPFLDRVLYILSSESGSSQNEQTDDDTRIRLLRLARRLLTKDSASDTQSNLLTISLELIQSKQRELAIAAREIIFAVITISCESLEWSEHIRTTIEIILNSKFAAWQLSLAYSLWLQQLIFESPSTSLTYIKQENYFGQIARGLQYGDTECRKLCLEILKSSVKIAVTQNSIDLISTDVNGTNRKSTKTVLADVLAAQPAIVSSQYARFCTVFETIILARYANQIAECENDLQQMLSARSILPSIWLMTLFNTALDLKTSEQTRKLIGKWLLSGNIERLPYVLVSEFLMQSFLPWACDGSLFVAATKMNVDEELRCQHGEQISKLVQNLLHSAGTANYEDLFGTFLSFVSQSRRRMYPYAIAFVFHGLLMAARSQSSAMLSTAQAEVLKSFEQWTGLPEMPRQFLRRACSELLDRNQATEGTATSTDITLQDDNLYTESISSLPSSSRVVKVQKAMHACNTVVQDDIPDAESLFDQLDDIWSDAEYLEYPRELMMSIPDAFFHQSIVKTAIKTDSESAIRRLLSQTLTRLQQMTATKSYLLAPILSAVRSALTAEPSIVQFLPVADLIIHIAESEPTPGVDLQMEYASLWLFDVLPNNDQVSARAHFGKGESYGYALLFDLVRRLPRNEQISTFILNHIIERWKGQKIPAPTISPLKTTLQLQILIICFENLSIDEIIALSDGKLLQSLYWLLSVEPLPRYRYLLAWLILRYHIRIPQSQHVMLETLASENTHSPNPKYLAALMKLSVEYCMTKTADESFGIQLATIFIALSASPKIIVRHEAQWSFPLLMDLAREKEWKKITENVAFAALDEYIRRLPRFDDPPPERVNARFSPETQHTLTNLMEGTWTELDYTRPPYARRADIVAIEKQDSLDGLIVVEKPSIELGDEFTRTKIRTEVVEPRSSDNILGGKQMSLEEAIALQTKGSAYLRNIVQGEEAERSRSSTIIIVGSLIDNAFNLGGLSRVGEIFGARALYLRDPRVIAEKDFMSTAVSSYNHLDIMPLSAEDLPAFLTEKKNDGWTCLGVEQTDRSVMLGHDATKLPRKAVLIIGNERQGIPGDVLAYCDQLVEIPQRGITRSLNVQTVAAVTMFEYNRQMPGR